MNLPYEVNRDALAVEMHLREFYHDIRFGEWNYASDDRWVYKRAENALALIVFSSQTGVQEVHGGIAEAWLFAGGPDSPLGLPTTCEECVSENVRKGNFQHGSIIWMRQEQGCRSEIRAEEPLPKIGNVISSGYSWMTAPGEPDATVDLHEGGLFIRWANGMGISVIDRNISEASLKLYKVEESHLWRYAREQYAEREHIEKQIKELERQCKKLNKNISLWREFDLDRAVREGNELASRLGELAVEKDNLQTLADESVRLKKAKWAKMFGGIPWKISGRLIAKMIDYAAASHHAANVKRIDRKIAEANESIHQIGIKIQNHNSFDWIESCIRLGSMQSQHRRAVLEFLRVDTALRGAAERIRPFEKEIIAVDEAIASANKESEVLACEIKTLERMISKLSSSSNSFERYEIHRRCEEEFDDGNPNQCLRSRRRRKEILRRKIAELKTKKKSIEKGIGRTLGIVEKNPNQEDRKLSQLPKILLVDGSNVVLASEKYNWRVLKTLLVWIKNNNIDYHLYFDQSFIWRWIKEYETGAKKKMELDEAVKVLIKEQLAELTDADHTTPCPSRDEADKFILHRADKSGGHVISNDGYRDWESYYPWIGIKNNTEEVRRVHKFTVEGDILSVPDLDIFDKIVNS